MGDSIELIAYGVIDLLYLMAGKIAPQRAYPVDIASALGVDKVETFAGGDNDGLGIEP